MESSISYTSNGNCLVISLFKDDYYYIIKKPSKTSKNKEVTTYFNTITRFLVEKSSNDLFS